MRTVRNVHARVIEAPAERVGALLDRLAADDDPLFPAPAWSPIRFDGPLGLGAEGGHGPVRYRITEYIPGRCLRFDFPPPADGHHRLHIEPLGPGRCRLVHTLEQRQGAARALAESLFVRPVHDTVVEELLDNAERAATGRTTGRPATRSPWVRLLNRFDQARPVAAPVPDEARLARTAFDRTDFSDAWRIPLAPGMPRDPRAWRGVLPFPVKAVEGNELLLGLDAGHLDFRASLLVGDQDVTLSTVVRIHNLAGRIYWGVVRHGHPLMTRLMLSRTRRTLALAAPTAGERHWTRETTPG